MVRRLMRVVVLTGVASVYVMQAPCVVNEGGISLIPNNVPNPFMPLLYALSRFLLA